MFRTRPVRARRRATLGGAVAAVCLSATLAGPALASPQKVGPPMVIDALGDSITRGFNSQGTGCGALADCPANSWATGTNAGVNSYFTRLRAINPAAALARPVSGTTGGNDAVTGAKMGGLPGQATNAVNAPNKPDQVMILLGANDVCTSSEATMTSVDSYRASFRQGMDILTQGLPDARIMVMSIPNIYNLWNVLKGNLGAQLTWGLAGICQSMLASPTSTTQANQDRRLRVQQRNIEFNNVLRDVCAEYIHCRYDNGAAYALQFASSDVGTLDYFHPNTNGQAKAAATAWSAGPNFADVTAPTTTITRDHPAGGVDDWYAEDVEVTLSATDATSPVKGTEYFYKLDGADDAPWTKYTGPITVSAEGQTTITARSVDVNGNIEASHSDVIKIDKTAPSFTLSCPSTVLLNSAASFSVSGVADDRSGIADDPSGDFAFSTASVGTFPNTVQIADRAGNTATRNCSIDVVYGYGGLEQPVNANGTSIFKLNSAVPLKFALADAAGAPVSGAVAKVSVAKVSNEVEGTFVEAEAKGASSTGNVFSQDGEGQYHYNLDTKPLSTGTWSVKVTLDDGRSYTTRISLR